MFKRLMFQNINHALLSQRHKPRLYCKLKLLEVNLLYTLKVACCKRELCAWDKHKGILNSGVVWYYNFVLRVGFMDNIDDCDTIWSLPKHITQQCFCSQSINCNIWFSVNKLQSKGEVLCQLLLNTLFGNQWLKFTEILPITVPMHMIKHANSWSV